MGYEFTFNSRVELILRADSISFLWLVGSEQTSSRYGKSYRDVADTQRSKLKDIACLLG
jgi:hypothetical protein